MECVVCGRSMEAKLRGRPRSTCGARCRKRLSRSCPFPREMVDARRWACAAGKRPVMVDGSPASSTDVSTWDSFGACSGREGFGFMLGGGFACIDLDGCLDDGVLAEWAVPIVAANPGAFIEVSVSGRGLHIFGLLTEGRGFRRGGVEVYSRARFIRVTGRVWQRGSIVPLVV